MKEESRDVEIRDFRVRLREQQEDFKVQFKEVEEQFPVVALGYALQRATIVALVAELVAELGGYPSGSPYELVGELDPEIFEGWSPGAPPPVDRDTAVNRCYADYSICVATAEHPADAMGCSGALLLCLLEAYGLI